MADDHSVRMVVGQVLSHWLGHLPVPWTNKFVCSCHKCFWLFTSFCSLQASDRKLAPARSRPSTPRELLMESIKKGRRLRPSLSPLKKKCEYQNYALFFWSRSGPLTTGLVFSVYTHSQYKLVPLSFHTIWCTCFTLYVVFLLTGPKSTDLRG